MKPVFDRPGAPDPLTAAPAVTANFYAKLWLGDQHAGLDRVWVANALVALRFESPTAALATIAHMAVHLSLADSFALDAFTAMLDGWVQAKHYGRPAPAAHRVDYDDPLRFNEPRPAPYDGNDP